MANSPLPPAQHVAETARYGLIGYPLGHSFSKQYFAEKFAREGIAATYENFEMPSLPDLHEWVKAHGYLRGCNVTIPHKQAVAAQMDELSPAAREIGAVNVVRPTEQSGGAVQLLGDNSDWVGFSESLRPLLRADIRRALVLGTGGASRAVVYALHQLGITSTYVSRQSQEGGIKVGNLQVEVLTYADLTPEVMADHLLMVNTTPLGMHPNTDTAPEIPYTQLTPSHVLYDLVYNPLETRFMALGKSQGAVVKNGLEMLHLQAEAAWKVWTNL